MAPYNWSADKPSHMGKTDKEEIGEMDQYLNANHLLAEALHPESDDNVVIEAPGRPSAPRPIPPTSATIVINRPEQRILVNTLAPERPLKLFRLEDFEFLTILGNLLFN